MQRRKKKTGRIIGWTWLALVLILIGVEAIHAFEGERYRLLTLGELWFRLDQAAGTGSLNMTQAIIQRHISVWLWESVIQNVLIIPAWGVFGITGLILIWRRRNPDRPSGLRR